MNRRNFFTILGGVLAAPFVPRNMLSATCGMFGKLKHDGLILAHAGELAQVLNAPALVTVHVGGTIKVSMPDFYTGRTGEVVREKILPELKRALREDTGRISYG